MDCGCWKATAVFQIIIIILLIYIMWRWIKLERLFTGMPNTIYTSGADLRRLGQVFSSTDQGVNGA
jgi:hypothetical protein